MAQTPIAQPLPTKVSPVDLQTKLARISSLRRRKGASERV
jgi:hypothetical protein